jgi:hypothetical protein
MKTIAKIAPVFSGTNCSEIMSKLVEPVKPYNNEHPYNNSPEERALRIKYFIPDSVDLILSLSIAARIYKDKDCSSRPR